MTETPEVSTQRLLAELWQRNQPLVLERLAQLDEAANAAATGAIPGDLRALAESNAHKLSGTLGMFGFHQGTAISRLLEQELQEANPDPHKLGELSRSLRETLYPHQP